MSASMRYLLPMTVPGSVDGKSLSSSPCVGSTTAKAFNYARRSVKRRLADAGGASLHDGAIRVDLGLRPGFRRLVRKNEIDVGRFAGFQFDFALLGHRLDAKLGVKLHVDDRGVHRDFHFAGRD